MTETEFQRLLTQKTRLDVAQEFATPILFSVNSSVMCFNPAQNHLEPYTEPVDQPDLLTLHCVSWERLYGILIGDHDLMEAFLAREIWTNGYLPLVFRLLAVFQSALTTRIPE